MREHHSERLSSFHVCLKLEGSWRLRWSQAVSDNHWNTDFSHSPFEISTMFQYCRLGISHIKNNFCGVKFSVQSVKF